MCISTDIFTALYHIYVLEQNSVSWELLWRQWLLLCCIFYLFQRDQFLPLHSCHCLLKRTGNAWWLKETTSKCCVLAQWKTISIKRSFVAREYYHNKNKWSPASQWATQYNNQCREWQIDDDIEFMLDITLPIYEQIMKKIVLCISYVADVCQCAHIFHQWSKTVSVIYVLVTRSFVV